MFITNDFSPAELLSEMLALRRATPEQTRAFDRLKHDKDLCPAFQENITVILDVYKAHSARTYDIQGFRDGGVDILIRLQDAENDIGIQIKSYAEIEKWARGRDREFIQRLKAQYSDATNQRRVNPYYVAVCTDAVKHAKQMRSIRSALGSFDRVKILSPEECFAFCNTSERKLAGSTAQLLCEDDIVLRKARSEIGGMSHELAHVVLRLLLHVFTLRTSGGHDRQLYVTDRDLEGWFQTATDDEDDDDFVVGDADEAEGEIEEEEYGDQQDDGDDSDDLDEGAGRHSGERLTFISTVDELVDRGFLVRGAPGYTIDITAFSLSLLAVCLGEIERNELRIEASFPYLSVLLGID